MNCEHHIAKHDIIVGSGDLGCGYPRAASGTIFRGSMQRVYFKEILLQTRALYIVSPADTPLSQVLHGVHTLTANCGIDWCEVIQTARDTVVAAISEPIKHDHARKFSQITK